MRTAVAAWAEWAAWAIWECNFPAHFPLLTPSPFMGEGWGEGELKTPPIERSAGFFFGSRIAPSPGRRGEGWGGGILTESTKLYSLNVRHRRSRSRRYRSQSDR